MFLWFAQVNPVCSNPLLLVNSKKPLILVLTNLKNVVVDPVIDVYYPHSEV